jgi:hypothetical protein
MELCLAAYINTTKLMKEAIGEPLDSGLHSGLAMAKGGVRYCMDTTVLIARKDIETFELPYLRRALAAFGGGWVHFCGLAPHLLEALMEVDELRGVNNSYLENQPYDFPGDMATVQRAGKFFYGGLFQEKGESIEDYFRRALAPFAEPRGFIFQPKKLGGEDPRRLLEIWYQVQEEKFG